MNHDRPRPFVFAQAKTQTAFAQGGAASKIIAVIYARSKAEAVAKFVRQSYSTK